MDEKNSLLGIILPGIIGILFGLLLGAISYLLHGFLSVFIFFGSYLIGKFMLKYLSYYTKTHKIIASLYSILTYLAYQGMIIFLILLQNGYLKLEFIHLLNFKFLIEVFLSNMTFLDWVIFILMPVSGYMYLENAGSFK